MDARSIFLLVLCVLLASGQICPEATMNSTSYFGLTVELAHRANASCSEDEVIAIRDAVNDALTNMNVTASGGATKELSGDICTNNDTMHRDLLLVRSYTWTGRATCRVCAPDTKVRRLVVGNETKEAADLASLDLTSMISTTFVNDPDFCLYEDSVAKVVVTVTETNKTLEDPCQ